MLDAKPAKLTKNGRLTIHSGDVMRDGETTIEVIDFESEGGTCRDTAALALVWAIGALQCELMKILEAPGNNNVIID